MNRFFLISATFFLLNGCKPSRDCSGNPNNLIKFKSYLNIIKASRQQGVETSVDEYLLALTFLTHVTGIMTKSDYSSTIGYKDKKDYDDDIKKWNIWLAKYKCKLTSQYVDSCLKSNLSK